MPVGVNVGSKDLFDASYGMGWMIQGYRGRRWIHHGGSGRGYCCTVSFLPTEGVGVVQLTNGPGTRETVPFNAYDRLLGLSPINWNQRTS